MGAGGRGGPSSEAVRIETPSANNVEDDAGEDAAEDSGGIGEDSGGIGAVSCGISVVSSGVADCVVGVWAETEAENRARPDGAGARAADDADDGDPAAAECDGWSDCEGFAEATSSSPIT
eukprot:4529974-Pleurochrysis_carterae.AAC.2